MADSYIQVAPDGTGKLMQTYLNTLGANAVHAEAVSLVDTSGNPITTLNVNVGSSINANFTGTVNVAQSGTWNIGTLASVTNPVTVNAGTNLNTANISVKVFQGAAFLASGQVAVINVATTIVAARATRRSVAVRNQDATNSGFIGLAPVGITNGILLAAGDSISVDFVGLIQGITATGQTATFGYLETYD